MVMSNVASHMVDFGTINPHGVGSMRVPLDIRVEVLQVAIAS